MPRTEQEILDRIKMYEAIKADRTSWRCRQKYGEVVRNLRWALGSEGSS